MRFKKRFFKSALLSLAVAAAFGHLLLAPSGAAAQDKPADDRAAIEQIIRDYLLNNPEILLEMQNALEKRQMAMLKAKQLAALKDNKDKIYNSPNQMTIGDPEAPITVVEFFDYNCGYCKRALDDMNRIVSENADVKFVMKEFPVLGEPSLEAHRVSLAVIRLYPELYAKFHRDLLSLGGPKNGDVALTTAVKLGADESKLKEEASRPATDEAIREVYALADGLGITGTPSYVIGDEVVFGAVGYNHLTPLVANIRKCGKTVC